MCLKEFLKKKEFVFLTLLFFIAFFLRSFRLHKLLLFSYDQGRDAVTIMRMIENKKFLSLIGPTTGLEGFFLGPFYHYLILPFYWLGRGNPVLPAVFLAGLGALAVPAIYFLTKEIFSKKEGLWAATLLTFCFGAVEYGRWLCNPPPLILFGILFFLFYLKSFGGHKLWAFFAGTFLGICFQLEFANVVFWLPLIFIYLFLVKKDRQRVAKFLLLIFGFLLAMFPLFIFDLRHDFLLSNVLKNSFLDKTGRTTLDHVLRIRPKFFYQFYKDKFLPRTFLLDAVLVGIMLWSLVSLVWKVIREKFKPKGFVLIIAWFLLPLIGLSLYTGNYGQAWDYYLIGQIAPALILITYFLFNLKNLKLKKIRLEPNKIVIIFLVWFCATNYHQWVQLVNPENYDYSLYHQLQVIGYTFRETTGKDFSVFIFVPNGKTESYDYLYSWQSRKLGRRPPSTVSLANKYIFLIYEPDPFLKVRFEDWYKKYGQIGKIISKQNFGIITVEQRLNEKE